MKNQKQLRRPFVTLTAVLAAGTLVLSACGSSTGSGTDASSESGAGSGTESAATSNAGSESAAPEASAPGGVFVFAGSADPVSLDPALSSDSETSRITNQIFEGLIGYKAGTADVEGRLATEWTQTDDGLHFTFTLRQGVKFSDGTDFNADAVCYNFDRWYNWTGPLQAQNISNLYQLIFGGFKTSEDPKLTNGIYESCEAKDAATATINLKRPYGNFINSLAIVQFAMQSPTALEKYKADDVSVDGKDVRFSEYATAHPTGTGPFMLGSWDKGQQLTLVPNPEYWGEKAKVEKVIVKIIGDPTARTQALRAGEIDGYDLVAPGDIDSLKSDGFQLVNRPPFNILYLGMNQAVPELKDIKVRQAISHAIDKAALIKQTLPEGSETANQFVPPVVSGWSDNATEFPFDPAKAKSLLAEAGQSNLKLDFYYPTGVSRPYMPNPEDLFVAIRAQLEAVGITINPIPLKWSPEYIDTVKSADPHGIYLLGGTLIINAPETLGIFFGSHNDEWGFDNEEIFQAVEDARVKTHADEAAKAYAHAADLISAFDPGVPLAHVPVTVALADNIEGFVPNPTGAEIWNTVSVK